MNESNFPIDYLLLEGSIGMDKIKGFLFKFKNWYQKVLKSSLS